MIPVAQLFKSGREITVLFTNIIVIQRSMVRARSPTTFFYFYTVNAMHRKKRPYEILLKNRIKNLRSFYFCLLLRSCLSRKKDKLKCWIVFIDVYGLLLRFVGKRYSSIG